MRVTNPPRVFGGVSLFSISLTTSQHLKAGQDDEPTVEAARRHYDKAKRDTPSLGLLKNEGYPEVQTEDGVTVCAMKPDFA